MIHFEHMSGWAALLLFIGTSVPSVLLGVRTMNTLGPVRKWVAIVARVLLLGLLVLILAGFRVERTSKNVEVMVLRDVSQSTQLVDVTGGNLRKAVDDYLRKVVNDDPQKRPDDRIGLVSFDETALVDAAPSPLLVLDARATREQSNGTDVSAAIQLALATRSADNEQRMKRLLLIWDGNQTLGNLDEAIRQAASQGVPIDVMPLTYSAKNEVIVERFATPPWKRENEPFSLDVVLRSTNPGPVTGNLVVRHQGAPMDLDPNTPGVQPSRQVTLQPGSNVEHVQVPALESGGVHQFEAIFEAPNVTTEIPGTGGQRQTTTAGDTIRNNNVATGFTFVRGKGQVLYIDAVAENAGQTLRDALAHEGITVDPARNSVDQFPTSLLELANYDAVIMANVRRGAGGLSDAQQEMLASYVKDMGGGLVMIGGPDTFGAGGWQGSKLEEVLPVNMDIPATRQVPKGALCLIMHSCEMPNGNYWGIQCAIRAAEVLSPRDDIGVLSYAWRGGGGSAWDYPLGPRGDGSRVTAAIKNMQLGDMPSFDDAVNVALHGEAGQPGLIANDAKQKHIIVISDGDPQAPNPQLIQECIDNQISISTVSVYPHELPIPRTMQNMADQTQGRAYGPIESNPSQLPEIFVKEATVVRRTLIMEDQDGIEVKENESSELMRGIDLSQMPPVTGLVLTSPKNAPNIVRPLVAGTNNDPLFAHWQVGLGKVAAFTSTADGRWALQWVKMSSFDKFWAQIVRGIGKPAESADFETRVHVEGDRGTITVEALDQNAGFQNFLTIRGAVVGPNMQATDVELKQVRPGVYEAPFKAGEAGNYVVGLTYQGNNGQRGVLRSGTVVNTSPEFRELQSNLSQLQHVADATRGRMLSSFDPRGVSLFTRDGLTPTHTPLPLIDWLLPALMGMVLLDIAIRRIAWDWNATKQMAGASVDYVRSFTTTRTVETTGSLDALRDIRARGTHTGAGQPPPIRPESAKPDPTFKFEAKEQVKGNLSDVVGGATDKPTPKSTKPTGTPKGQQGDKPGSGGMSSLFEAKKKAQDEIRRREEEGK